MKLRIYNNIPKMVMCILQPTEDLMRVLCIILSLTLNIYRIIWSVSIVGSCSTWTREWTTFIAMPWWGFHSPLMAAHRETYCHYAAALFYSPMCHYCLYSRCWNFHSLWILWQPLFLAAFVVWILVERHVFFGLAVRSITRSIDFRLITVDLVL